MGSVSQLEDQLERLYEDRQKIKSKLNSAKFRRASDENIELANHLEKHLASAEEILDSLLEIVTAPENQGAITQTALDAEKQKCANLESELEKERSRFVSTKSMAARIKEERDRLVEINENLNNKIKKLEANLKMLGHDLKKSKRK